MNRVFVEKQAELNAQACELLHDLKENLNFNHLSDICLIQRYDVQGLSDAEFSDANRLILSEPQVEATSSSLEIAADESASRNAPSSSQQLHANTPSAREHGFAKKGG